jgi:hypothetical protein
MRHPPIPALSAPSSAWNRMFARMFDTVDRVMAKRRKPPQSVVEFRARMEPDDAETSDDLPLVGSAGRRSG